MNVDKFILQLGGLFVALSISGAVFTLSSFAAYLTLYLLIVARLGWLADTRKAIPTVVAAGLVSICAAEAGSTYVIRTFSFLEGRVDHLANVPVLLVNFAALLFLFRLYRRRLKGSRLPA